MAMTDRLERMLRIRDDLADGALTDPVDVEFLLAELDRLRSWDGLMELLDEHWPEDIFPTLPDREGRDLGPRIVSLIRWVNRLRTDRAQMLDEAAGWLAGQLNGLQHRGRYTRAGWAVNALRGEADRMRSETD